MTPLNQSAKCFTYRIGLQVSWLKAKFIHVRGGPDPPPLNIGPNGDSSFVFLGFTSNGDLTPEISTRHVLPTRVMQSLWKPLWRQRCVSWKSKLCNYNSSVLSVLLFGAETRPLTRTLEKRIDSFDSKALRTIENIRCYHHDSNEELRMRTNQPATFRLTAIRRICWYGHNLCMPPDHPTKALLLFDPKAEDCKRPCERP